MRDDCLSAMPKALSWVSNTVTTKTKMLQTENLNYIIQSVVILVIFLKNCIRINLVFNVLTTHKIYSLVIVIIIKVGDSCLPNDMLIALHITT